MLEGIPLIDAISPPFPPRTTYCMTASPHAQAGFAISQPASWNGHFCSAASMPRPRAWLPGGRNHQAGWPGLRQRSGGKGGGIVRLWHHFLPTCGGFTSLRGGWTSGSTWCHGTKADEVLSFCRFEIPLLFFNTVCYQSTRKQTHHPGLLLDQSQMRLHER